MIENQPLPFSPANLSPQQIVQHRQSWQRVEKHYSSMTEWLNQPEDSYSEFVTYRKLVQQLRASPIGDCFFASTHHSLLAISTVPQTISASGSYVMISLLYPSDEVARFKLQYYWQKHQPGRLSTIIIDHWTCTCTLEEIFKYLVPMLIRLWQDVNPFKEMTIEQSVAKIFQSYLNKLGEIKKLFKGEYLNLDLNANQAVIEEMARKLYDDLKNKLLDVPEYREVNPLDYPYLDLAFYDTVEADLKSQGFKLLGNYTMANWKSQYTQPTFIRSLVKDEMIVASIWHLIGNNPLFGTRHTKVVEYDTSFSDNRVIQTTPQTIAEKIEISPEFMRHFVDPRLSPGEILHIHQNRINAYRHEHLEVTPLIVHTLSELFILEQQQAERKATFRHKLTGGIYSKEEIQKLAPYPLADETVERIREAMRKIVK